MAWDEYFALAKSTVYDCQGLKKPILSTIMMMIQAPPEESEKPNELPEMDGYCWGAQSEIAERTGCDVSTVKTEILNYVADGWLVIEKWVPPGDKRPHNRYKLAPGAMDRLRDLRRTKGSHRATNSNLVRPPRPQGKHGRFTSEVAASKARKPSVLDYDDSKDAPAPVIQPKPAQTPVPAPPRQPYVAPAPRKGFGDYISECREAIVSLMEKNPPAGEFSWTDFTTGNKLYSQFDKEGDAVEKLKGKLLADKHLVEGSRFGRFTWDPAPKSETDVLPKSKVYERDLNNPEGYVETDDVDLTSTSRLMELLED